MKRINEEAKRWRQVSGFEACVSSKTAVKPCSDMTFSQATDIAERTFDYIVLGGGTGGLTVASRLAEDPAVSVLVLEAGEPNLNDPLIMNCGYYTAGWGNPKYDWYFMTAPQKYMNGRMCQWTSGKVLGGGSALNFLVWSKPQASDVDAWEKLGNPGWNWQRFQKHANRLEHFTDATEDQLVDEPHIKRNVEDLGSSGPIKITLPWSHGLVDSLFLQTMGNMGVPDPQRPYGGDALTGALASKIIFSDTKNGVELEATGVEFLYEGKKYVVHAGKEVIVSSGTSMSPGVLERSGIGRKDVLEKIGVPVRVDLPGVGENVQDHVYAALTYELKPDRGYTSFDMLKDDAFAKEQARLQELDQYNLHRMGIRAVSYHPLQTIYPEYVQSYYDGVSAHISAAKQAGGLPPGREEQYDLQMQALRDASVPDFQSCGVPGFLTYLNSLPDPEKFYVSIMGIQQHPFSRGSIHVSTTDPSQTPTIDPRTFENPYDLELAVKGLRYLRRMAETEPWKSSIVREVDPGLDQSSDEQLKEYIKKTANTVHHPVGSLSMLPREKNGCVDANLKVYGTKNVRVADNSIIPLHISAHTQSTAYVIGDILADILKNAKRRRALLGLHLCSRPPPAFTGCTVLYLLLIVSPFCMIYAFKMGNAQSMIRTSGALDSFVAELGPDVVYEGSLGSARFLKTVKCRHKNGYLVVKIFIKPDPGLSLRKYHKRLKAERDALADIPNVYTYQTFVETDKAGYLVRQWVASSLYDRISTRPFLSPIEKKWLAFQLLTALRDARNRKISHGDLKTSNILITSWNWLLLSDFASYKPALLPLDDPADFSYFFDTSGRRTCYIAPERFYSAEENPEASKRREREREKEGEGKREKVTEAMDCFSAGCVIAELFLEGAPLFTLSQLFKYREGELSVESQLASIDDEGVRSMIKQMIAIDPATRPTFETLLHTTRGTVFPESFYSFLHNYVASVNELSAGSPFSITASSHISSALATPIAATPTKPTVTATAPTAAFPTSGDVFNEPLPSDSDHRMERIWADYDSVEPYLLTPSESESLEETVKEPVKIEYSVNSAGAGKPLQDIFPVELDIPNRDSRLLKGYGVARRSALEDGPALILLALLTANVRTCRLPSSKLKALDVFLALSPHLTDEAKLDRMVPYVVELLQDDAPSVRSAAVRTLMQILMLVTVITPSNASIFPEYIIPALSHLVRDPEVSVRCMYAQCVVSLADTAVRYLEMGQALRAHGAYKMGAGVGLGIGVNEGQDCDEAHFEVSYEASMQELQVAIQEHLSALLVDPSPVVKRAVLHNISALCIFLGRQRTNDVLLSHMITYLNDRDWLLRFAFFDCVVDVAACAGGRSLEDFILPLMIQALSGMQLTGHEVELRSLLLDVEESVVAKVLASLTSLCELGLFQKMRIWELMSATLGFLYHPNTWIRQGAAAFIASAAKHLPPGDVWCILYPSLKHFLRSDIRDVDERSLLIALKPPLSRQLFDAATQWAMKADRTHFWRTHRSIKSESPKDSLAAVRSPGPISSRTSRSEEDETQLTKLQQLGMTSSDESKLMSMRDFILKLAQNIARYGYIVSAANLN
ncbi:hypothetical protein NM688_g3197 [Phlebia brevispora]|uniref:Uncharacterized protein n=1 Tax=Phlebia brevispora TaxID=194682 RepID=A0ACC1T684_9APHY|nr:hypothetical protein NM688_g3197 [Phlebia brevispora]